MHARSKLLLQLGLILLIALSVLVGLNLILDRYLVAHEVKTKTRLIKQSTSQALEQGFYKPVSNSLNFIKEWGANGVLKLDTTQQTVHKIQPFFNQFAPFESFYFASNSNRLIVRIEDNISGEGQILQYDQDASDSVGDKYNLLDRVLSGANLTPDTSGYFIYADKDWKPGEPLKLLASVRWDEPNDTSVKYLAGFEIAFDEILNIISFNDIESQFIAFMFSVDPHSLNPIYSISSKPDSALPDSLNQLLINQSLGLFKQSASKNDEYVRLKYAQKKYYVSFVPARSHRSVIWFGIIHSEDSLTAGLKNYKLVKTVLNGLFALFILFMAFRLYRIYKRNYLQKQIDPEGHLMADVMEDIAKGEQEQIEFKSTMRMNLQTGKTGKEIELAWAKAVVAFLNTRGGKLLVGVADNGDILGLDADRFENEDRCRLHFKNILQQHIGLEFSQYVHLDLVAIDGKTIAYVSCQPSSTPVFLRDKSDEIFYIRSGPSSVKLSTREVLDYLENRKQE